MKRGITRNNFSPFEQSPEEIRTLLLFYLPAFTYIGAKTVATVCTEWNRLLKENNFFEKKSYSAIIEDCLKNPKHVLYILSDASIRQYLSWEQILELSGCNYDLAKHILQDPALKDRLIGDVAPLGKHYLDIANLLLNHGPLGYMTGENLSILAEHHLDLAQRILRNENDMLRKLFIHLDAEKRLYKHRSLVNVMLSLWYNLDISDKDILDHLTNDDTLRNRLRKEDLTTLGEYHSDLAWLMITDKTLLDKLDLANIASLCKHRNILKYVYIKDKLGLRERFSRNHRATIAAQHHDIAIEIFDDATQREELDNSNLVEIGIHHVDIAKRILNDDTLRAKLNMDNITRLGIHLGIAVKDDSLRSQLCPEEIDFLEKRCEFVDTLFGYIESLLKPEIANRTRSKCSKK